MSMSTTGVAEGEQVASSLVKVPCLTIGGGGGGGVTWLFFFGGVVVVVALTGLFLGDGDPVLRP